MGRRFHRPLVDDVDAPVGVTTTRVRPVPVTYRVRTAWPWSTQGARSRRAHPRRRERLLDLAELERLGHVQVAPGPQRAAGPAGVADIRKLLETLETSRRGLATRYASSGSRQHVRADATAVALHEGARNAKAFENVSPKARP